MGVVVLFLPHLFRGCIGLLINRKMPRSHHIVKDLELGDQIGFDHVKEACRISAHNQFISIAKSSQIKMNLKLRLMMKALKNCYH